MNICIGKKFIDFNVPAVLANGNIVENLNFYNFIEGKFVLVFFYPMDFTFVCPSELIAINNRVNDFKSRNVEIICISIDSQYTHKAWIKTDLQHGGLGNNVNFVLASDIKREVSLFYGILDEDSGVPYRVTFLLDEFKIIRVQHVYDFPIGRNIDEYIRSFDALIFNRNFGYVCQAGWNKGDDGITPSSDGVGDFLMQNSKKL